MKQKEVPDSISRAQYIQVHEAAKTDQQSLMALVDLNLSSLTVNLCLKYIAAESGCLEALEIACVKNNNINFVLKWDDTMNTTPLDIALLNRHIEVASYLIHNGGLTCLELEAKQVELSGLNDSQE